MVELRTSRFATTALIDSRRVSHMIYGALLQQQSTLNVISTRNIINMAVVDQRSPPTLPSVVDSHISTCSPATKQSAQVTNKSTNLLPWMIRFDRQGLSAQIAALPKGDGSSYQAAVHLTLLGKMYSIYLQMAYPSFSFNRILHFRNIVPNDSAMTVACRTGDFNTARKLLTSGAAHGSDVTLAGWPMLDVGIDSLLPKSNADDLSSTLLRAGLLGSFACSSNTELI